MHGLFGCYKSRMTQPRKPPTRRTPEQRAAYHADKLAQAKKAAAEQARSADTHRKIVVGAALIGLAETGDPAARALLARIKGSLVRPRDRAAFGLLDPETPVPSDGELRMAIDAAFTAYSAIPKEDQAGRRSAATSWRRAVIVAEIATGRFWHPEDKRAASGLGALGELAPRKTEPNGS